MKNIQIRSRWLKPAAGLTVINPATGKPLPAEGGLVEMNKYWRRRLKDGDVLDAAPPKPAKPSKKED